MRRRHRLLASIVLGVGVCGCGSMIDHFVFFPEARVGEPPRGASELWLRAPDGPRLHAWYVQPAGSTATLVWSHGNGGNIAVRADVLLGLAARGLGVLAYDYRGYGRSEGAPSEDGVYRDAQAAYDALRERGIPASRLVSFGESLGGAVSIQLATQRPCAAVVVVSTFTTLRDVARVHYGPLAVLAGARFDSAARLASLSVPFFAAHGDRDAVVPFDLGARLFALAREPKTFLSVPGAGHDDVLDDPALLDGIAAFVAAHVRG
ncbi:MAG: alpha/beta hydrolase [Deltaproteobacteria bacterium]|nr:alpha/beta hydrolase [Deltaproteobacteria bacterium]